ncbi:MAG: hypothetical protein KJO12_11430 [Ignavibacteria bacterium]|nr:hypothetical protein [Ignavibacteria bacterium]
MRSIVLYFILISIIGCSNEQNEKLHSKLLGKWKWIESSGGIDGRTETPESTGNDVKIEITRTTIKTFVNGILESEINYEIEVGSSIRTTQKTDLILYENGTIHSVLIIGNSLVLFEECYDCFQHNYLKVKK